jgi:hypothetical protein
MSRGESGHGNLHLSHWENQYLSFNLREIGYNGLYFIPNVYGRQ